ncbi:MAG TPA: DUF4142 domain-containing protein [Stellaceae bacterium]|nr:DUF4142 domain-containing protein [Stellaceae bacterium]
MGGSNEKPAHNPAPGSKSNTVSATKEAIGGAAGVALAAMSITRAQFIHRACIANLYVVEAAKIAERRAQRADVREFAKAMRADHEKMGRELKSFIGGTNSPQSPPEELDAVHQTLIDNLHGAANEHFDERYVAQQKIAHQEAITLFKTYQRTGTDDGMRSLIGLALPVLEGHLQMVRRLEQDAHS